MRYEAPMDNVSQRGRPLIEKHEMRDFPDNQQIILVESSSPIKANKLKYFSDKNFKSRDVPAPIVPKLNIMENDIPKFNIPTEEEKRRKKPKTLIKAICLRKSRKMSLIQFLIMKMKIRKTKYWTYCPTISNKSMP